MQISDDVLSWGRAEFSLKTVTIRQNAEHVSQNVKDYFALKWSAWNVPIKTIYHTLLKRVGPVFDGLAKFLMHWGSTIGKTSMVYVNAL